MTTTMTAPEVQTTQVYVILIKASQEAVWEAITEPEFVAQYFHGARLERELKSGGLYRSHSPDGSQLWVDAQVIEVDPPRRFVHGWRSLYNPECAEELESRVSWEIEAQEEGICKLTVVHDQLEQSLKTAASVAGVGWMTVLSGLKTLLETGQPLAGPSTT